MTRWRTCKNRRRARAEKRGGLYTLIHQGRVLVDGHYEPIDQVMLRRLMERIEPEGSC